MARYRLGNRGFGFGLDRILSALISLFITTIVYYTSDSFVHELADKSWGEAALAHTIGNLYYDSWNTVIPVFVFVAVFYILTAGRQEDRPSSIYY